MKERGGGSERERERGESKTQMPSYRVSTYHVLQVIWLGFRV